MKKGKSKGVIALVIIAIGGAFLYYLPANIGF